MAELWASTGTIWQDMLLAETLVNHLVAVEFRLQEGDFERFQK